jgi:hypothetical protein
MNRLRSCSLYRAFAASVICPALLLALRVTAPIMGLRRLRVGKLSILGDAGFLSLCNSSVECLAHLDPILHRLITERPVCLLQSSKATPYVGSLGPPWLFSISPRAVEWKSDGIVARLIYIAFCISRFPAGYARPEQAEATHKAVMALSRSWLDSHGFPRELVESYGYF